MGEWARERGSQSLDMAILPQSTRKPEETRSLQDLGELVKSLCSFQLFTSWVPWRWETGRYSNRIINQMQNCWQIVNENRKGIKRDTSKQGAQAVLAK